MTTFRAIVALLILIGVPGVLGNMQFADELEIEAAYKVMRPVVATKFPPEVLKCKRINAAGQHLRIEISERHDDTQWVHECHYGAQL